LTLATCDDAVKILQAELQNENAPLADLTNSVDTKRHLAGVLLHRILRRLATHHVEESHV
jgi:CO/xanthine dehydrogenase FAD-binding subunit